MATNTASLADLVRMVDPFDNIHLNVVTRSEECFENLLEDIILKQGEIMRPNQMEHIIELHSKLYANRLKLNCLLGMMVSPAQNVDRIGRIREELSQLKELCNTSDQVLGNLRPSFNVDS